MALLRQAYSVLFRRTSTFALTIVLGAVLFERAFDQGADAIFEHLNEGLKHFLQQTEKRGMRLGLAQHFPQSRLCQQISVPGIGFFRASCTCGCLLQSEWEAEAM
uniref:Cytochrome b-c1 complex subunit 9 n=1 Tax=Aquila chrysaetos chrysaetos TaxID=223781 RepID=A0A663DTC0_AQUCH